MCRHGNIEWTVSSNFSPGEISGIKSGYYSEITHCRQQLSTSQPPQLLRSSGFSSNIHWNVNFVTIGPMPSLLWSNPAYTFHNSIEEFEIARRFTNLSPYPVQAWENSSLKTRASLVNWDVYFTIWRRMTHNISSTCYKKKNSSINMIWLNNYNT